MRHNVRLRDYVMHSQSSNIRQRSMVGSTVVAHFADKTVTIYLVAQRNQIVNQKKMEHSVTKPPTAASTPQGLLGGRSKEGDEEDQ